MSAVTLDGRCVIVTGAGAGVGRGVALACATAGTHVIVGYPHATTVSRSSARSSRRRASARGSQCDVTDEASIVAAVVLAVDRAGALHAIVHNATSNR